jgi:hypothetical protein
MRNRQKGVGDEVINMLNLSDQIHLMLVAVQNFGCG